MTVRNEMIPETPHIICDHIRFADLLRMDTSAGTPPEAQAAAEAMAG